MTSISFDDGTYGEVDLDATLDLLLAFLSGEDDSRRSDLVDRQPVDSRSKLSCDVATVAGDSELLRFPSGREDERSSVSIEDDVSSALLDIYDALHAASVDYYGSSTIHAAVIGRSLDLEGIPLLRRTPPRTRKGSSRSSLRVVPRIIKPLSPTIPSHTLPESPPEVSQGCSPTITHIPRGHLVYPLDTTLTQLQL